MENPIKRKLVVEPTFQMRYAFVFAVTCFILGAVATGAIVAFGQSYYTHLEKAGAFLTPTLAQIYRKGWWNLCTVLAFFTLAYSVLAFYMGLVITRNIVGPVIAFRHRVTRLLESGVAEDFELRSKDELQVLKDIYTQISSHQDQRRGGSRSKSTELHTTTRKRRKAA